MGTCAVVLHSGGLDSTVCLLLARQEGRDVISLGIDYGQRHRVELDFATALCRRFDVPRKVLKVGWSKPEREIPMGRSIDEIGTQVSPAFLPARNGVFLMLACAEAAGLNASEVWIGVNSVDFLGYPDCTPEFIDAFRSMVRVGLPNGPELLAPLQNMSKPDIARIAQKMGLSRSDTWSCYRPRITMHGLSPCEQCDACKLHFHAWNNA